MHEAFPTRDENPSSAALAGLIEHLALLPDDLSAPELIDAIAMLERLKSACAAAQAQLTAAFADSRLGDLRPGSPKEATARRSVAAEIGLARRESPSRGSRHVGLARVLVDELPNTLAALADGEITEWQATLVARETALLTREDRMSVDAELADTLGPLGDRGVAVAAAKVAYRLDPKSAVERMARAESERRVSIRPAPECMTYVTALLPLAQGIAVHQSLRSFADQTCVEHAGRGRAMADEFTARVLGPVGGVGHGSAVSSARPGETPPHTDTLADEAAVTNPAGADSAADLCAGVSRLPVGADIEIHLVMTDRTLFDGDTEPVMVNGFGPAPAPLIRHLLRTAPPEVNVFVRRIYADSGGRLIGGDARRRLFPDVARQFLISRDQMCRTPWCEAPIRHVDHVVPYAAGGLTSLVNGQGLCERCNQTKGAAGWRSSTAESGRLHLTTPTGRTYTSSPPDAPRRDLHAVPDDLRSRAW